MNKIIKSALMVCAYASALLVDAADEMKEVHPVARARKELEKKMMAKREAMRFGKFEIVGNVVSEQGEALDGVSLSLTICTEKEIKKEERVVNKTFEINYGKVNAVRIVLTKLGFYEEARSFTTRLMKEDTVIVELVEIGQPVALQEFQGFISFCPTGMSMVASFVPNEKIISSLSSKDILAESGAFPHILPWRYLPRGVCPQL
ncbi:MAG: hypothetical protein PHO37_03805 [Kiritimatiellae bacterium]|nr:hypothetical protein [Kiritimatiellia bacterium]